ncbi:hypothetical protein POM88_010458 [Heracleum sosnowskyi]|uniref:Uncharacterized protein n=1 Tax=Heracleum sosnowskyi TaxID=360622 RepID=A0AAD8ISM7_9APIA|nr:hypothetical protein POM88_010458 [Heracleum sosnowskyi]
MLIVDSVKPGSTVFHQMQLRGSKFSNTVIFGLLWNKLTSLSVFLEMGDEEETVVLVPGHIISINLGDIVLVPAEANMKGMTGMDTLRSDKTKTLTFNKFTIDKKNLIQVCSKEVDADIVVLMAARALRTEKQDAIDTTIVGMLADPKEARARAQIGC